MVYLSAERSCLEYSAQTGELEAPRGMGSTIPSPAQWRGIATSRLIRGFRTQLFDQGSPDSEIRVELWGDLEIPHYH